MEDEEEDDGGDERGECCDDGGDTDAVQRREDGDSDLDGGRSRGLTQCLNKKVFLCVGAADNSRSLKAKKARDRRWEERGQTRLLVRRRQMLWSTVHDSRAAAGLRRVRQKRSCQWSAVWARASTTKTYSP